MAQLNGGFLHCTDMKKFLKKLLLVAGQFFSSPEHKVLRVSYCDRPLSVARRLLSIVHRLSTIPLNIFSYTAGPILMKLGRDVPCVKLYKNCSKNLIPSITLVAMATKRKKINKIFENLLL